MHTDTPLISTIVAGLVLAFIFGAIANRFRMPPLVGYLVAGVLVGPLHARLRRRSAARARALRDRRDPADVRRRAAFLAQGPDLGAGARHSGRPGADRRRARCWAWAWACCWAGRSAAGLIFGLALSVASTVVLLKALQDRHLVDSERGRIAVGWLIVEDIAMVLALVLIPALAAIFGDDRDASSTIPSSTSSSASLSTELGIWGILGVTVIKLAAFVGFMLVVGRRVIPLVLHFTAHTGRRELFRLAVLAIALGVAAGAAYLFGVILALGAFFAGMILSESELSHRAAQETLPLRDAFAVLFFVVGRHAVRPDDPDQQPAAGARHAVHHPGRQVGRRLPDRARLPAAGRRRR